ncbi:DNA-binding NarL/FixJ family response regulator [Lipingzhangella halophila]|uniref:DNA-binding NarL/FixJ family response regulator n=1 Tax=Lipingzhangella halophila TaxID=1783352 RepID=A0A7W7W334_9ACTN|nr:response regulator transcription factor [Lipingzhangella halophila]MBB4932622.1 DNA-binding NarL/FixJ family response regulator [Lipingzhangella halophila]
MIKVLIADDHPVVRDGVRGAFAAEADIEVAGEAADGREAVERAAELGVDVVLMDLRMPEMDGVQAIAALAARAPGARALVLTTFDGESDVLPAIEAGAAGYLLKDAPTEELLRAVRAVRRGESVLAPTVAGHLMAQVRTPAGGQVLSDRELEVLRLVAGGASNRTAAARLFISEASIKTHLQHIYDKLGVRDRAAAVAEAYRRGVLS